VFYGTFSTNRPYCAVSAQEFNPVLYLFQTDGWTCIWSPVLPLSTMTCNNAKFLLPRKLQSKVSKHEVWWEITNILWLSGYCVSKLWILVQVSSIYRRLNSRRFFSETWCICTSIELIWFVWNVTTIATTHFS